MPAVEGRADIEPSRIDVCWALNGHGQNDDYPVEKYGCQDRAKTENGAVTSAVLGAPTRGTGPLRLALAGATRSGSAGVASGYHPSRAISRPPKLSVAANQPKNSEEDRDYNERRDPACEC